MNITETILLTAIINATITGLIAGVAIYRVQKGIDVTIQKSLFEYQKKFESNHPKKLEVLATLRLKFGSYVRASNILIATENRENIGSMMTALIEFHSYFSDSRMYLNENLVSDIDNILSASLDVMADANSKYGIPEKYQSLVENINKLEELTKEVESIYRSAAEVKN